MGDWRLTEAEGRLEEFTENQQRIHLVSLFEHSFIKQFKDIFLGKLKGILIQVRLVFFPPPLVPLTRASCSKIAHWLKADCHGLQTTTATTTMTTTTTTTTISNLSGNTLLHCFKANGGHDQCEKEERRHQAEASQLHGVAWKLENGL